MRFITFQKLPKCNKLKLRDYLLEPIQRIPRYKLYLEQYVHKLPADSDDITDAKIALDLVSQSASHVNEYMKMNVRSCYLSD